jgi:hypothetical protein
MIDQMCAIVDGQPTMTAVNACLQTLTILIVGYGLEHGDTDGLATRAGQVLATMVKAHSEDHSKGDAA